MKVVRFIIQLTVVNRIINFITVQFNISYTVKAYYVSTRGLYFHDQDKSS